MECSLVFHQAARARQNRRGDTLSPIRCALTPICACPLLPADARVSAVAEKLGAEPVASEAGEPAALEPAGRQLQPSAPMGRLGTLLKGQLMGVGGLVLACLAAVQAVVRLRF